MMQRIGGSQLVFDAAIQSLCIEPYPDHPKGCPNHGKRPSCPPGRPLIDRVVDLARPLYLVWTEFDLEAHARRMSALHPEWSERQIYCCLYWQGRARKAHREEQARVRQGYPGLRIIAVPEAHGLNVTACMARIGVMLEWPPRQITRVVSLAGFPVEGEGVLDLGREAVPAKETA